MTGAAASSSSGASGQVPRRLDKYLRDSLPERLTELRVAIRVGRVVVRDGQRLRQVREDMLVFAGDEVTLDGRSVEPTACHSTLVFHKPRAVTSTRADPDGKRDLSAWLGRMPAGVFPVGRLDRETTGLLLFTSDGDLSSAVTRPDHRTQKTYWLWLDEVMTSDDSRLRALQHGVMLHDGWARAEQVVLEGAHADYSEIALTLREGRNRQVRRMCRALDLRLLHLHRRQVGPLTLQDLAPGEFRLLTPRRVEALWQAVGGRALIRERKISALGRYAAELRRRGQAHTRLEAWLAAEARGAG